MNNYSQIAIISCFSQFPLSFMNIFPAQKAPNCFKLFAFCFKKLRLFNDITFDICISTIACFQFQKNRNIKNVFNNWKIEK